MRAAALLATALVVSPAFAQRTTTGGGVTGQQSLGRAAGGGGFEAGNAEIGELSLDAGSAEGVNREFGDGLVGRGDSTGRFVGNESVQNTTGGRQRATFNAINRQRATLPRPPASPVRATLRVNFPPLAVNPRLTAGIIGRSRQASERALDRLSPKFRSARRGETAVLVGSAESEQQRRLAEALLRLEPGVRRVENRATVTPYLPPPPAY